MWLIKKRFLFFCFFIVVNTVAFSHSPTNSSTVLIKGENEVWILQVRASLTAFEQEVHTRFSKDSYNTPEEFKDLVVDIFENNVALFFNKTRQIALKRPQIKLGHEVIIIFQFKNIEDLNTITIKNEMFKNIYNSKNIFFIIENKLEKKKFILNKDNNFKIQIKINDKKLINIGQTIKSENKMIWWSALSIALILITIVILRKKIMTKKHLINEL